MILIDSNILIDLLEPEGQWRAWSTAALLDIGGQAQLVVNAVIVAEIARQFATWEAETRFLSALDIEVVPIDDAAGFRAGKAYAEYRAAGGVRDAILADFLIGGHAAALDATLLTRDRQRFARYFPDLTLITPPLIKPETDHG